VVISNLQFVLVYYLLSESRKAFLFASWIPPAAVCIEVARKYCAVSLSDDATPVNLPRLFLPGVVTQRSQEAESPMSTLRRTSRGIQKVFMSKSGSGSRSVGRG